MKVIALLLAASVLSMVGSWMLTNAAGGEWSQGLLQGIATELLGGVVTYVLIDLILGNVERERAAELERIEQNHEADLKRINLLTRMLDAKTPSAMHAILDEMVKAELPGIERRNEIETFGSFLSDANTIWVLSPSAFRLLESSQNHVLKENVKSVFLFSAPSNSGYPEELLPDAEADQKRLKTKREQTEATVKRLDAARAAGYDVNYRVMDAHPGFYMLIKNPHQRDAVMYVEFVGQFDYRADKRFFVHISASESKYLFDYWRDVFVKFWQQAEAL